MLTPQQLQVTSGGMTLIDEQIQLAAGGVQGYSLDGANPYEAYTLTTSGGFAEELNIPSSCGTPALTATAVCGRPAGFTVTNSGSALVTAHSYRIESSSDRTVLFSGSITLGSGESAAIVLPDDIDATNGVIFVTDDFGVTAETMLTCSTERRTTGEFTGLNAPQATGINAQGCGRGCKVSGLHTDKSEAEISGWTLDATTRTTISTNCRWGSIRSAQRHEPSPNQRIGSPRPEAIGNLVAQTSGDSPEASARDYKPSRSDTSGVGAGTKESLRLRATAMGHLRVDRTTGGKVRLRTAAATTSSVLSKRQHAGVPERPGGCERRAQARLRANLASWETSL